MKYFYTTLLFITYCEFVKSSILLACIQGCEALLVHKTLITNCKRQCYINATMGGSELMTLEACMGVCSRILSDDLRADCRTGCSFIFQKVPMAVKTKRYYPDSRRKTQGTTKQARTVMESTMMTWL